MTRAWFCDMMLALGVGSNSWQQRFNFPLKDALLVGDKGRNYICSCSPHFLFCPEGGALSSTGQAVPGPGYHSPAVGPWDKQILCNNMISQKGGKGEGLGLSCRVTLSGSDRGLICRQGTRPQTLLDSCVCALEGGRSHGK